MGFASPSAILPPSTSFNGQTILITGGTTGLGLATAIHYVQLGASTVIITARNAARGATAVASIEAHTLKKGVVQVRSLDMNSFQNVKQFVDELQRDVKTIDVVLLNAGVFFFNFEKSPEGWESDLQVNVLSTTLLALLLLPWMKSVQQPAKQQHLGIVGSSTQTEVDITADKFPKKDVLNYWNKEENYPGGQPSYGISKLLLQYAALEISKLAIASNGSPSPIVNVVCPGPVKTDIAREFTSKSFLHKMLVTVFMLGALSPEVGARALVLSATTSPAEHKKFLSPHMTDKEYESLAAKNITNEEGQNMQATVWREILQVLEVAVPEVKKIARPKF